MGLEFFACALRAKEAHLAFSLYLLLRWSSIPTVRPLRFVDILPFEKTSLQSITG